MRTRHGGSSAVGKDHVPSAWPDYYPPPPGEVTFEEWVEQAHIPEGSFHEGMQRMYAVYAKYGFAGGNALVLRAVLGREPRSLEAFFKELSQSEG